MTAQDVVDQALAKIGVIAAGETPSTEERARGIEVLNLMIGVWNDALARALAGSYASDLYMFVPMAENYVLATSLTVSVGWQSALVYNLAVELAFDFGRPIAPELIAIAEKKKQALVTLPAPVI